MAVCASKAWMPREVQMFPVGWGGAGLPGGAVVGGSEDRALRAAGPCDSVAEGVDAAEAGGGVGLLDGPLGLEGGGECQEEDACVVHSAYEFCGLRRISRLHEREPIPGAKARFFGGS